MEIRGVARIVGMARGGLIYSLVGKSGNGMYFYCLFFCRTSSLSIEASACARVLSTGSSLEDSSMETQNGCSCGRVELDFAVLPQATSTISYLALLLSFDISTNSFRSFSLCFSIYFRPHCHLCYSSFHQATSR